MNLMKNKILRWICVITLFWVFIICFYYVSGEEFRTKLYREENTIGDIAAGELLKDYTIEQSFISPYEDITGLFIYTGTYDRTNTGTVRFRLLDDRQNILCEKLADVGDLPNNSEYRIDFNKLIKNAKGNKYVLQITSIDGTEGNAVTCWYSTVNSIKKGELFINGSKIEGSLSMSIEGKEYFITSKYYWHIAFVIFLVYIFYFIMLKFKKEKGLKSVSLLFINDIIKYSYLIKQLVAREFKTKYKRSALGMFWSVLNPLLTMLIQYIVFSTIFKTNIPNYPVYLLTGIVLFNFFTEAILTALQSIVNNASLITKVYVPKYIYPVTKIFSSVINLIISLVPLVIVILITNTHITKAVLLLPFGLLCLIIFSIGFGLILASAMVFFRDTQFLWSIASMLWMYMTPIFYPESIIPAKFILILKLNPLYHYIRFCRTIIIEGVSPEPKAYISCLAFALVSLLVGSFIFKKSQNKFVLYI